MTTKNVITEDDLGLGFQKSAQGKLLTAVRVYDPSHSNAAYEGDWRTAYY